MSGNNIYAADYAAKPWLQNYSPYATEEIGELKYKNIPDMVTKTVKKFKKKKAFTLCLANGLTSTLTFAEIDSLSNNFACYLRQELMITKGSRVGLQLPNSLASVICALGVFKAGCVLVNINPLYTESEMLNQINDAGIETIVVIDMFANKVENILPQTKVKNVVITSIADFFPFPFQFLIKTFLRLKKEVVPTIKSYPNLKTALKIGNAKQLQHNPWENGYWKTLDKDINSENNSLEITHGTLALLQYTGGTTGVSKGAMLTHGNLLANVQQLLNLVGKEIKYGEETVLTGLPLFHIFAFTANFLAFFSTGAHNILIPSPKPVTNLKPAFQKFPITWTTGVNSLLNAFLQEDWFLQNPPKYLRNCVAGGTALATSVQEKWTKIFNKQILEGYGLTECSPCVSISPIGGKLKTYTIGVPLPSTEIQIINKDGLCVEIGKPGELAVKGPQVMSGYWQNPEETAKVLQNGWLFTGDIAIMSKDGYLNIVDRKKDMILVSGFNVYPNEIEDCLMLHPDILEAAVISIPDKNTGEAPRAYIVSKNPSLKEEDIRAFCKIKLSAYKVPRSYEFRTTLPKSNVGKVLRKELREEYFSRSIH